MRVAIAALMLASVLGCGTSPQSPQAEEAAKKIDEGAKTVQQGAQQAAKAGQQGADQMAQGLQQMAQGFQQMAQGSAKVVDYELLKALLPDVAEWTKSNARGEQLSMPVASSRAEATYEKDDSRIDLEITDTALSQLLLAPLSMFMSSGFSERSDEGFKRAVKIGGFPGFEEWNAQSKHGEVTVVVNSRFVVQATGSDVASLDAVRKVVTAVPLGKLAALP